MHLSFTIVGCNSWVLVSLKGISMSYNIGCYCCYSNLLCPLWVALDTEPTTALSHHPTALSSHPTALLPENDFLIFPYCEVFITNREHGQPQRKCARKLKPKAKPFVIPVYFKEKHQEAEN